MSEFSKVGAFLGEQFQKVGELEEKLRIRLFHVNFVDTTLEQRKADVNSQLAVLDSYEKIYEKPIYFLVTYRPEEGEEPHTILLPLNFATTARLTNSRYLAKINDYIAGFDLDHSNYGNGVYYDAIVGFTYTHGTNTIAYYEGTEPKYLDRHDFSLAYDLGALTGDDMSHRNMRTSTVSDVYSRNLKCDTWYELNQYLNSSDKLPAICLRTSNSVDSYPAAVGFTGDNKIKTISIIYTKEVGGVMKVVSETFDWGDTGFEYSNTFTYTKKTESLPFGPCSLRCVFAAGSSTGSINEEDAKAYIKAIANGMESTNVVLFRDSAMSFKASSVVLVENNGSYTVILYATSNNAAKSNDTGSASMGQGSNSDRLTTHVISVILAGTAENIAQNIAYYDAVQVNTADYLKLSNIHVVAEYPADLSAYPDGAIFIKQA